MEMLDGNCRCVLCYMQLQERNTEDEGKRNLSEILFKILAFEEFKDFNLESQFRLQKIASESMSDLTLLFCPVCEDKLMCISDTLKEFEVILLKLIKFRGTIEDDLVRAYILQSQTCSEGDPISSLEKMTRSSVLRESLIQSLDLKKRNLGLNISLDISNFEMMEEVKIEDPFEYESLASTVPTPHALDDYFEEMTTNSDIEVQDLQISIQTQKECADKKSKDIKIPLQRIDDLYPFLRKTKTRIFLSSETSLPVPPVKNEALFTLTPPSDLLDMSYYVFPTKCLIPECTNRSMYADKRKLRRHIRDVHIRPPRPIYDPFNVLLYPARCPDSDCKKKRTEYPDKSSLLKHMKSEHSISEDLSNIKAYRRFPTKCREKGCKNVTSFLNKQRLAGHIRKVHSGKIKDPLLDSNEFPIKCPVPSCKVKVDFDVRWKLRRHLRDVHRPDKALDPMAGLSYPTKCLEAGCKIEKLFTDRDKLKRHMLYVHQRKREELPKLQCEQCGELCKTKKTLEIHKRIHTGETLICEECGSQFRSESGLRFHRDTNHAGAQSVFPCTICPKTFKLASYLRVHMNRHNGVKKEFCQLCPAGFLFKWELRNHQTYVHSEELNLKKVECHICGKSFTKAKVLKNHMVQHIGGGRYTCDICPYSTALQVDFREHMDTVHSSEFKYECNKCGKKFKLERRLRSHLLTHQEKYDHECPDCQQRFLNARTLRVHIKRKHPVKGASQHETNNFQDQHQDLNTGYSNTTCGHANLNTGYDHTNATTSATQGEFGNYEQNQPELLQLESNLIAQPV